MKSPLHKVTVYLTDEEYAPMKALAEDEGVTISAVLRARLGLSYKRRGAPAGNVNRRTSAQVRRAEKAARTRQN